MHVCWLLLSSSYSSQDVSVFNLTLHAISTLLLDSVSKCRALKIKAVSGEKRFSSYPVCQNIPDSKKRPIAKAVQLAHAHETSLTLPVGIDDPRFK